MNKIDTKIMNGCTKETCCRNELVFLPLEGDVGFEEYFNFKATEVNKVKHLFAEVNLTSLILTYPDPTDPEKNDRTYREKEFGRFFESPSVISRNQDFEGCFGIDISAYINHTNTREFIELMSFIRQHPKTTYVLFAYTNNINESDQLLTIIEQYIDIYAIHMNLPDNEQLTKYICDQLRNWCPSIDQTIEDNLCLLLNDIKTGYDFADYFVRMCHTRNFSGNIEELYSIFQYAFEATTGLGRTDSYGY